MSLMSSEQTKTADLFFNQEAFRYTRASEVTSFWIIIGENFFKFAPWSKHYLQVHDPSGISEVQHKQEFLE